MPLGPVAEGHFVLMAGISPPAARTHVVVHQVVQLARWSCEAEGKFHGRRVYMSAG